MNTLTKEEFLETILTSKNVGLNMASNSSECATVGRKRKRSSSESNDNGTSDQEQQVSIYKTMALPCSVAEYTKCNINDNHMKDMTTKESIKTLIVVKCNFDTKFAETLVLLINRGLEKLFLSESTISGECLQRVGENIAVDCELTDLDLSHIRLDKTGVQGLLKITSKARKLEWLNLDACKLDRKLLEILSEAKEDDAKSVKTLLLSSNSDIREDIKIVAALIDKFDCDEIDISCNSLDDSHIAELSETSIKGQVTTIHAGGNSISNWSSVGDLVKKWRAKDVDVSESGDMSHFQNCAAALNDYQGLKSLELRGCKFNDSSIANTLVELINKGLETIVLSDSEISGKHLQYIGRSISKNNLKNLDLSNVAMDEDGVKALSKISSQASTLEWINLHNCKLDENLLRILSEAGERDSNPIRDVTLSSNPGVGESIETVASIAEKFGCEEIDISSNSLVGTHFAKLAATGAPGKIATIRVSENPIDKWELLGDLAKKWKIKNLDASQCIMYLKDVEKFKEGLGGHRFNKLYLCHDDRRDPLAKQMVAALKDTADHSSII